MIGVMPSGALRRESTHALSFAPSDSPSVTIVLSTTCSADAAVGSNKAEAITADAMIFVGVCIMKSSNCK